jgi:hypothetical protein
VNIFSIKSIGLYSLAIGSSIVFFHLVTSYGEAHLQAPPAVAGVYTIADSQKLPDCLRHPQLALDLQQSGVYLTAHLTTDSTNPPNPNTNRPILSGRFRERQLQLDGLIPTKICPQLSSIHITGTIAPDRRLQGRLSLSEERLGTPIPAKSIAFTGTPATTAQTARPTH